MFCFAVFHQAKQVRVFSYVPGSFRDRERAKQLAIDMAQASTQAGYPSSVEEFGLSGVGCVAWQPE